MKVSIAILTLFLSISTFASTAQITQMIHSQKPFYLFEDQNGLLEYKHAKNSDDCTIEFRDAVTMRKGDGNLTTWAHTRIVNLGGLNYIKLQKDSAPRYYQILFGGPMPAPILIKDANTTDENGTIHYEDSLTFDSFLRFDDEKAASEVAQWMEEVGKKCVRNGNK